MKHIAWVLVVFKHSDRCRFGTETVRGGRWLGGHTGPRGLEVCGCGVGLNFVGARRERTKNFNPRRTRARKQLWLNYWYWLAYHTQLTYPCYLIKANVLNCKKLQTRNDADSDPEWRAIYQTVWRNKCLPVECREYLFSSLRWQWSKPCQIRTACWR